MKKIPLLSAFLAFSILTECECAPMTLVENGEPRSTVVLGENPTRAARFAAAEFRHVVKLMTGADIPVSAKRPDSGVAVWIGCGTDEKFAGEEYAVRFREDGIVLAGHDAADYGAFDYADAKTLPALTYCFRSTTYAVYDFLEKWCGVRFYGFGDEGIAFVPSKTLTVDAKGGYRRSPKMDAYRWPYVNGHKELRGRYTERDERLLLLRWRMNAMFGEVNHSVMGLFIRYWKRSKHPVRRKYFIEERHDYFAQGFDGMNAPSSLRKWDYPGDPDLPPQICTSAEGPVDYFADEAVRMHAGEKIECTWAARPVMEGMPFYYPVQEDDCCWWCKCGKCQNNPRLKEYNSRHFDWVNRIARKAREKDPSVGIGTLAYSDSLLPPDIPLEKNVLVQMCLSLQSWFHPYTYDRQHGAYRDWVKKAAGRNPLTLWLYLLNPWSEATSIHKYGKFFPIVYPRHVGKCFREFNDDGIRGFFAEIAIRYHLLEGYVAAKLADDPSLDPDEIIDEHYRLYYGAAGAAMKRFSDTYEKESFDPANYTQNVMAIRPTTSYIYKFHTELDNWRLGSAERVARLDALMKAAKAAAKTPLERKRIDDYCWRIWNTAVEGRREYELRERQRSVGKPFVVASWGEKAKKRSSSEFVTLDNRKAKGEASFAVSADAEKLYFSFGEKGGDALEHAKLGKWMNGVELFLADDQETKNGYLQIAVGADGSASATLWRIDEGGWRAAPQPPLKVSSSATAGGWRFSFSLPFASVPGGVAGGDLFANVFRTRRWEGGETTAWSPIFCADYRASLHRNGRIFTSAPTENGPYPLDYSKWRTPAKPADGERFGRTADGIVAAAGAKKPLVVMQDGTFPACHVGDRITMSFEARGKGPGASACLYLLTGRHYGAGTVQRSFAVTKEWKRHEISLTVREMDPKRPPTVYRPGFLLAKGTEIEIRDLSVTAGVEKNYDFRKRLECLHPPRRAGDAAPAKADETVVDSSWKIVALSDDPVVLHAAADLADYFSKSMDEKVAFVPGGQAGPKTISIGVAAETNSLTARIAVSADRIRITGATAREAAQGCYRLEDAMNFRGIPAVRHGEKTHTRMFSPRMVHSGWELDKYPDVYLDHLAHIGMDAVLTYVTESPDMTRNGREDMPDLVRRAALRGLDVYVYAHQIAASSHMHPDDPGAAEFCDRLWGSIVKNAPGLKGMVFVGESIAFTSKDPEVKGFWWKRVPGAKRINGFYPTLEWVPWLKHVRDATRKYNPAFDIVFWTYNWSRQPEKARLELLEKIPDDITVHVTFEMGDARPGRNGVNDDVDDYSILFPGPSKMFMGEAGVVSRRGIRLTSMANTGGRTWDCGVTPFVPVPDRWLERHEALRQAHRKWNLTGLMESHHYGFQPNFIAEIAKASFTEEADGESVKETLRGIAARDFGCMNVDAVMAAWHDWSEAFRFHSARWFDQSGPLRLGPTFPLVLPGEPWPLPPHPQYEWYEGRRYGNGWKYLGSSYNIPPDQIEGRLATTEKELALWRQGNGRLESALRFVPEVKRPAARRMLGLGRFYEHTVRTVRNSILFKRDGLVLTDAKSSDAERIAAAERLYAVLGDEEENVRETIPFVEADSSLGWEPSMFYVADREHLEWKLRQLGDARLSVSVRSPADTFRKRLWMWGHHAHAFRTSSGNERKWFGPDHLDMGAACMAMGIPNVSVCRWQALPKPPFDAAVKELSGLSGFGWSITDNDGDYSFAEKANIALDLAKRHPKLNSFWLDDYFASSFVRPEVELYRLKDEMRLLPQNPKLTVVFYSTEFNRDPKPTFDACDQISFWVYDANDIPKMEERLAKCRELAGPEKPILLGIYMWNFPKKAEIPRESMQRQLDLAERLMRTGAIHGLVFHCTPLVDTDLEAVKMCKDWIRRHGEDRWGVQASLRNSGR